MSLRNIPEGITVLSLFDGIACGLQALKESGFKIKAYYASEVDKHAIRIAKKNHPEIIHVGDVRKINITGKIKFDLLIGGSPCQGFSFAGKGLNFNDPRSALFFEYIRIKNDLQKFFPDIKCMLENVRMKNEWAAIISGHFGNGFVFIDSADLSATKRKRFYWANFPIDPIIGKSQKVLKDILVSGPADQDKAYCIDASYAKGTSLEDYLNKCRRQIVYEVGRVTDRADLVSIQSNGNIRPYRDDAKRSGISEIGTVLNTENKSVALIAAHTPFVYLTDSQMEYALKSYRNKTFRTSNKQGNMDFPDSLERKAKALCATVIAGNRATNNIHDGIWFRLLTPIECERLHGLTDNYTEGISQTQRYKALGNGWQLDTIKHIFKSL